MKFWKLALVGAAASLALGGAAFAQDEAAEADSFSFSYNAGVATDYIFRGVSQTDGPQVFGGVDLGYGPMYAGAWASNVDFGDDTDAEIDLYVGVKPELGPVTLDIAAIYYAYVGDDSDSDYEYAEFKLAGSVPIGPATVGVATYYSPEFFGGTGTAFYYEVNGGWAINDKWSIGGAVGKQEVQDSTDYTTWNFGVGWAPIDKLALDLRYHDSDLDCATYCGSKVVLTLKTTLP
ncbi:MAG: TorF family putative porin [Caulobacter sp.]|nr:TorF family putative porin [Caulobacter sp.]